MNSILSYIFLIILLLSGCKEQEKNATTVQTPATHTDSYALIKSWGEYVRKGEYEILIDTAKTYYRKAIANHDKKTQAYVGAYIGQAYILSGQADSMFTYFNAAIPYVEEHHDTYIQTIIANGLGINARNTTLNYNASLAYFQEALQYADASEDKTNYYIILSNMTRIYYLRNDPSGIKYALEVYEGGSKLHNDYVRFLGALNVATMYYLSKNYDEALHYISEATAIATHMANTDEPDVIHGNILAAIGKPQQAELYFRKVLNHTQRTNIDVLTEAYLYYGNFLKAERRYDEANTAYQNGLILSEQQNHYYYRLQFYKGMAELFQEKGDIAMASQHKERHQSLADSIFNIEQERSFSHMILNYETEKAEKELEQVKIEDEVTDVICEQCGRNMVVKYGPHGKFLACPGFPDCRNTKPYLEKIGVPCPICGKDVVIRKTKKGRRYYGCEDNPECEFMSWQKPSTKKCPRCGAYMLEKGNKLVCSDEQCGYVENIENTKEN